MSSRFPIFWVLFSFLIFSGCKKNQVPLSSPPATDQQSVVNNQNLSFSDLSAKGKVQFEEKGDKLSSSITMRIRKDSVIWISVVPALGIEVARLKITRDSVYMLNRLQKEYFMGDYSFIKEKFRVDVNFDLVQSMLLGNYLPGAPGTEKIIAESPYQHSRQENVNLIVDQFLDTDSHKLRKLTLKDTQTQNAISVDYSNFEMVENKPFAKAALIVVQHGQAQGDATKGATINLDYSKIEINQEKLSFPFSVPGGYNRK